MSKRFLITRPEHDDTTRYLSSWSRRALELAQSKGIKILDLNKERANRKEVEGMLVKQTPELVVLNGHGNDDVVTGHKNEPLIKCGQNEKLLKGKITYAISCRSAKNLGRKSVQAGAKAYIGYEDDFIFLYDQLKITRPLDDETAGLFLKPATEVVTLLLKGYSAVEASNKSKELFKSK